MPTINIVVYESDDSKHGFVHCVTVYVCTVSKLTTIMLLSFLNLHFVYFVVFVHVATVNTVNVAVFMNIATLGLYIFMTVALATADIKRAVQSAGAVSFCGYTDSYIVAGALSFC